MISIQLDSTDLENFRFAYSPMIELVSSFKLLHDPSRWGMFMPWVDDAMRALDGIDLPYMYAAIQASPYIADFVTQTPQRSDITFNEAIAEIRNTPAELIRNHIECIIEEGVENEIHHHFLAYPADAVECLIAEMTLYWERVLAQHWPRIQTVLENDVLFRAREMALQGVGSMLTNLNPMMQYLEGQLLRDKIYKKKLKDKHFQLGGRGLQLVPAMLGRLSWQVVPEYQPMIIYRARGAGLWYAPQQQDTEKALVIALGEGKARLLSALNTPSHTTELARKLGITAGAVSQQLSRLSEAGLVQAHRSSNKVYYRLSPRGEKLLMLFME
jgi:DNA-binding transcriptional ArsR family regulator